MLMSGMLLRLLLAGSCLCVGGNPVHLLDLNVTQDSDCDGDCERRLVETGRSTHTIGVDVKSKPSDTEHVTGLILNVDAGGGAGPEGIAPVLQEENGDSLDGRSGPSKAGGEAWSQNNRGKKVRSSPDIRDDDRQPESVLSEESESSEDSRSLTDEHNSPPTDGAKQLDTKDMSTSRLNLDGIQVSAASPGPAQLETSSSQQDNQGREERTRFPGGDAFPEPPSTSPHIQRQSPLPAAVFVSSQTSTPLTIWGHDGATISSLPEPLLPEFGPDLMPRDEGLESLWTEAARPDGVDTVDPLSQDEATEGTMSSEALPLIFEPFEDVTPEGAASAAGVTPAPGSTLSPAAMATGGMLLSEVDLAQLVTVDTDNDGPSHALPLLMPDWMSPWQTSGAELQEPISSSVPSVSQRRAGTEPEDHSERVAVRTPNLKENLPTAGPSLSSFIHHTMTTVAMVTHQPVHKSRSGLEEMESEEEHDEDDEDENSEESVEDDSEEDLTDSPQTSSTQPPYSLIPPPPVWVQRNQGLMRSWVELIREKAGYVSGMLAPVGIGITGALLIVGALYSIRMIHRKRRNSFKHQRRKVRQPEQPREHSTTGHDQAMLLADSSEDEF
ncbi:uncharacterized protein LOC131443597 isoform X1 [Solea solea]|uniref:uncharacterized protein LOC131443597 isoform X1 n=1 Tax=Solea solea TaxID=90069 RepID=UPI00272B8F98|nr:uncharacterized protein LOC131443597 isoform X1 [Solea solea]